MLFSTLVVETGLNTAGQKMIFSTFEVKIKLHFIFKSMFFRFENKKNLNFNFESRENHFSTSGISHPVGICHPVLRYLMFRIPFCAKGVVSSTSVE